MALGLDYEVVFVDTVTPNGKNVRYPDSTDLSDTCQGVYVYNESTTYDAWVNVDKDASGSPGDVLVPRHQSKVIPVRFSRYVSIFSNGFPSVNLVGFRKCRP